MSDAPAAPPVRVLFVDDEENILKALARIFLDEDFEVMTAPSGAEGLRILSGTTDVALIVSDQRMPGMSGAEFLEKARELAPDALRIVLTGYADINAAVDAINKGGAYRYLAKPWDDDMLTSAVRESVDKFRLLRENRQLQDVVRKQNDELKEWNQNLNRRVLDHTRHIREQYDSLSQVNAKIRGTFREIIAAFSGLIGLRDESSRDHSTHVAEISRRIAQEIGVSPEDEETIHIAALLHDIGKIGIPDALLRKNPAAMSAEEKLGYMLHPVRGQTAIDGIEALRPAGILVRHHHESFDGRGFPDRLKGESIPLGARIIAIADALDRAAGRIESGDRLAAAIRQISSPSHPNLDPDILKMLPKSAAGVYGVAAARPGPATREIPPNALQAGMVLAREVRSGTGIMLLPSGTLLDSTNIEGLQRHYRLDPGNYGILVRNPG